MDLNALRTRFQQFRRRLLMVGLSSGVAWAITVMLGVLVAGVLADLLWELPPGMRVLVVAISVASGLTAVVVGLLMAWQAGVDPAIARQIDRAGGSGGEVLTGYELSSRMPTAPAGKLLSQRAVARAARLAEQADPAE